MLLDSALDRGPGSQDPFFRGSFCKLELPDPVCEKCSKAAKEETVTEIKIE